MDKQGSFLLSVQELAKADFERTACGIEIIKSNLDKAESDALESLITQTQVSTRKIAEMLKGHGHIIGDNTIWKHRKKSCPCFRVAQ